MNLTLEEKQALVQKLNELNGAQINQTLLIQALINILKSKKINAVPMDAEGKGSEGNPIVTDQEIVNEFVKVRDAFIEDTRKQKIITPNKDITVVENAVEVAPVETVGVSEPAETSTPTPVTPA